MFNVCLPSRELTFADALSTRWQQRWQHFAADRSKRQLVAAWVVDIVNLDLIHMLLHDSPNLVMNGVQGQTVGSHSSGEMKSAVSRADQ